MPWRCSLAEISFIFICFYALTSIVIFEYKTTFFQNSDGVLDGLPLNSADLARRIPFQERNLPLTAHVFKNGIMTPILFDNLSGKSPHSDAFTTSEIISPFPVIDSYPDSDPYLPWIHDIFPSDDLSKIVVISQNRRRCHTGKKHVETMKFLEPQIALFQPISLKHQLKTQNMSDHGQVKQVHNNYTISNDHDAIVKETRFQCRFKVYKDTTLILEETTFSQYPFNYEYITWRKRMAGMFEETGKGMAQFWLSSLEFHCPIPQSIREKGGLQRNNALYLDIATIPTSVRKEGEWDIKEVGKTRWDVYKAWGENMPVPEVEQSTRWENIRIPQLAPPTKLNDPENLPAPKPHKLVACTWSSAAHNRRGDAVTISDGKDRLREWIAFNLLVGFDHVYVYDNSAANTNGTSLKDVTDQFDSKHVTHINWPCKICNNNRPAHDDPGERSSQYAAEASCRARFGPRTDWMASLDPDEYLVPMGKFQSWKEILAKIDETEGRKVIKFRSTRARPRLGQLEPLFDPNDKTCPSKEEVADKSKPGVDSCLVRKKNETFLKTYNCEYIKSPKPERFQRAMVSGYCLERGVFHFPFSSMA